MTFQYILDNARRPGGRWSVRKVFLAMWLISAIFFLAWAGLVTLTESHRITSAATVTATDLHDSKGRPAFSVEFRTPSGTTAMATATTSDFLDQSASLQVGRQVQVSYTATDPQNVDPPDGHIGIYLMCLGAAALLAAIIAVVFAWTGRGPVAAARRYLP